MMGWGNETPLVQLKRDAAKVRRLERELDQLRGELNERLAENISDIEALTQLAHDRNCARAEMLELRAEVDRYAKALLSMRFSKYRDQGDWAWLNAEGIGTKLAALAASPTPRGPEGEAWAVDLIDCGRDDGVQVCATWAEADAFRRSYIASAEGMQHCERTALIRHATAGTRLGYHDRAPYFPGPATPTRPTEETPPTRCDHGETGEHRWPCDSICDASGGGSCFTPWCKCRCHHGGCSGPGGADPKETRP